MDNNLVLVETESTPPAETEHRCGDGNNTLRRR